MTNNTTSSNATVVAATASSGNCNFRPFTETEKWLQVSSFLIIDAISIFGNAVVICIIRRNQRLHSPTNYFIVNLCFANLMIMLVNTSPYILGRIAPQLGFGVTGKYGFLVEAFIFFFFELFIDLCLPLKGRKNEWPLDFEI